MTKTLSSAELVARVGDLFDSSVPYTPEEIKVELREAGYDPDQVGARMKRAAENVLIISMLNGSAKKVKAGLTYAASGQYQDYPEGILELGVVLDAIDMLVNDILSVL